MLKRLQKAASTYKYFTQKLSIFLFLMLVSQLSAKAEPSTLKAGDLAIVGCNRFSSSSIPFELAIVALRPINAGTIIYISDYGYSNNAGGFVTTGLANEGAITWSTSYIPKGQVILIKIVPNSGGSASVVPSATPSSYTGMFSVTGWIGTATATPVSLSGDNWFIYQGTSPATPTNFIFGWANYSSSVTGSSPNNWLSSGTQTASSATTSELPPTLINGSNALSLASTAGGGSHGDYNVFYISTIGTKASLLNSICEKSNWLHNDIGISYKLTAASNGSDGSYFSFGFSVENESTVWNGSSWSNGEPHESKDASLTGNISGSFTCGTLTIGNGASVNTTGGTVTVYGNMVNNGNGITGTGTLTIGIYTNCTLTGNALAFNGTLQVNYHSSFNTNDLFTLSSNATATGRIGNSEGYISGNVTVERYIPAGNRAYRLLTPTVSTIGSIKANWQEGASSSTVNPKPNYGTHITGNTIDQTNGFDGTATGNASLFQFNNATQLWGSVANTDATTLKAGNAYRILVRGNRAVDLTAAALPTNTATTLRATGTVQMGVVTMNSTGSGATDGMPLLSGTVGGYSFVGNPYASPVSWSDLHSFAVGLQDYYYTWDPTRSTHGAYVYWDKSDASNGGSVGSAVSNDIQPGQAIFVRSTTTTPELTFREGYKSTGSTNTFRTQGSLTGKLAIGLTNTALLAANNGFDGANILFADNFSAAIDGEDIPKISNQDENLSVFSSSTNLMKEARPTITANDTVQLRIWQLASNSYILTFDAEQFEGNKQAYLMDAYLNTVSPISTTGSTQYPFTTGSTAASYSATRFSILFKTAAALPVSITGLKAFQQNAGVQVEWNTLNETNMAAYQVEKSVDGTSFNKAGTVTATGNSSYNWYDASPVNGSNFYRIKLLDKSGSSKYTQVVNVKMGGTKNTFSIGGNPIRNRTITLQMESVEKGSYTVKVFNSLGQQVATRTINHAGGSATETIALANAPAGTYQLSILGNNVKETRTIIIE